ncbi:MAG: helix-turn-helix transcriptional regulator [Alphaproteobacteria bacterium]|nr:helix-turn-helix transcriptional regulator [Alphaproteobacteria bacterium]
MSQTVAYERRVEPVASNWRRFTWSSGSFDTASRPYTEAAEGTFCTPQHLMLVTLKGGAQHQEVAAACGHRFAGPDRAGAVSFVPAHCPRQLKMRGIESEWASIALDPALFDDDALRGPAARSLEASAFTNAPDRFLAGMLRECTHLFHADGILDPTYCDEMSWTLAHYLVRRYGRTSVLEDRTHAWRLPAWRLRRVADYVEEHLDGEIRIAELAALVGVSAGYFHRAFRVSTGRTPLAYVNERRICRAMHLLETERISMIEVALSIGFMSPSHFTRTFRAVVGINPSKYRALTTCP